MCKILDIKQRKYNRLNKIPEPIIDPIWSAEFRTMTYEVLWDAFFLETPYGKIPKEEEFAFSKLGATLGRNLSLSVRRMAPEISDHLRLVSGVNYPYLATCGAIRSNARLKTGMPFILRCGFHPPHAEVHGHLCLSTDKASMCLFKVTGDSLRMYGGRKLTISGETYFDAIYDGVDELIIRVNSVEISRVLIDDMLISPNIDLFVTPVDRHPGPGLYSWDIKSVEFTYGTLFR